MSFAQATATPKTERCETPVIEAVSASIDFASIGLLPVLLRAVVNAGYTTPTPIQLQAIPHALAGRDVVGCAQTGTGKTAAFVLPMLQRMLKAGPNQDRRVRALILAPTRELAAQIGESIAQYGQDSAIRHTVIFGGVSQSRQVQDLRRGVDIIVATPGRLWDLLQQRLVRVDAIDTLVLDEFDRMLDQGFLPDIKRILSVTATQRQTLLFSATMPKQLESIVKQIVKNPVHVAVSTVSSTPEKVNQSVWFVDQQGKRSVLEKLLRNPEIERAIVFTRTKHGANRVAQHLTAAGVDADAIHGNKSQNARERTLSRFRDGDLRVLVATDLAARGIDVDGISHVINYDLPVDPESYVHRIGRTARAGRAGAAVSLCSNDERPTLSRIERLIAQALPVAGRAEPSASGSGDGQVPQRSNHQARESHPRHVGQSRSSGPVRQDVRTEVRRDVIRDSNQAAPQRSSDNSRGRGPNRPYPRFTAS